MAAEEPTPTIFTELARRRSRSSRLSELALEQGISDEVARDSADLSEVDSEIDETAFAPAFDESELDVSNEALQDDALSAAQETDESPAPLESPPPQPHLEIESDLAPDVELEEGKGCENSPEEESKRDDVEVAAETAFKVEESFDRPEETIALSGDSNEGGEAEVAEPESVEPPESISNEQAEEEEETSEDEDLSAMESILAEEPRGLDEIEVNIEAESIVDQIGPVVDIQALPKSRPSRVLSKAIQEELAENKGTSEPQKSVAEPKPDPVPTVVEDKADEAAAKADFVEPSSEMPEASKEKPKKKKKRVSLLDSYFKGL